MILPIIEYGSLIYDNASQSDLNRLDSLHRRAGIICTGAYHGLEQVGFSKTLAGIRCRHDVLMQNLPSCTK